MNISNTNLKLKIREVARKSPFVPKLASLKGKHCKNQLFKLSIYFLWGKNRGRQTGGENLLFHIETAHFYD